MARHDDMPKHDDPTEAEPRPKPAQAGGNHATTAQLRQDIISGATQDKVAALDPAAAPLGTDAEAAGLPPSPATVATARLAERRTAAPDPHRHGRGSNRLGMALLAALMLALLLGLLAFWQSFR